MNPNKDICYDFKELTECWRASKLFFAEQTKDINPKCLPALSVKEVFTEDIELENGSCFESVRVSVTIFDRWPQGCASVDDLRLEQKTNTNHLKNVLRDIHFYLTSQRHKFKYHKPLFSTNRRRRITVRQRPVHENNYLAVTMQMDLIRKIPKLCCESLNVEESKLLVSKFSTKPV